MALKKYTYNGVEYCDAKLIDGSFSTVKTASIVGYCQSTLHRGYITKKLLKQHKCLERKCSSFRKIPHSTFWQSQELEQKRKEEVKAKKLLREEKEEAFQNRLNEMKIYASKISHKLFPELTVTNIRKNREEYGYIINYVTDTKNNDYYLYLQLAREMSAKFLCRFILRKAKLPSGHYATKEDIV